MSSKETLTIGYAPTRRAVFSRQDALKYKKLTLDKLKSLGYSVVDIEDINEDGFKEIIIKYSLHREYNPKTVIYGWKGGAFGLIKEKIENIENKQALLVPDQLYWGESEGNLGISFTGKFSTTEQMAETLNLLKVVGSFNSKEWKLHEILVSTNLNANGDVATWTVSGPMPLLLDYLEQLKAKNNYTALFYDFGYSFVNFKPSAFWEHENE